MLVLVILFVVLCFGCLVVIIGCKVGVSLGCIGLVGVWVCLFVGIVLLLWFGLLWLCLRFVCLVV